VFPVGAHIVAYNGAPLNVSIGRNLGWATPGFGVAMADPQNGDISVGQAAKCISSLAAAAAFAALVPFWRSRRKFNLQARQSQRKRRCQTRRHKCYDVSAAPTKSPAYQRGVWRGLRCRAGDPLTRRRELRRRSVRVRPKEDALRLPSTAKPVRFWANRFFCKQARHRVPTRAYLEGADATDAPSIRP
jgi:hypothetical protein